MCQTCEPTTYVHKWSDRGLPVGPYRVETIISFPSRELAGQNPEGYRDACNEAAQQAAALGVAGTLGTCHYCGMNLMNNVIIRAGDGSRFVVGLDCAMDARDAELATAAQAADRSRRLAIKRAKADAAREVRRQKWAADMAAREAAERERNGGMTDAEKQEADRAAKAVEAKACNAWLIEALQGGGDFAQAMVERLERSPLSRFDFTDRMLSVMCDMYARGFGRRGSLANDKAATDFYARVRG